MDEWIEEFATALRERSTLAEGRLPFDEDTARALLDLAGQVAHGTGDRTDAPLSTFLAGCYVQARGAEGLTVADAIGEVAEIASSLLPPAP